MEAGGVAYGDVNLEKSYLGADWAEVRPLDTSEGGALMHRRQAGIQGPGPILTVVSKASA